MHESLQYSGEFIEITSFTFPNGTYSPFQRSQRRLFPGVALGGGGPLFPPKIRVRCRSHGPVFAFMTVPETAMNKYYCSVFWKNNVRLTGEILAVKTKAIAQ
jgi:hypothetical protein